MKHPILTLLVFAVISIQLKAQKNNQIECSQFSAFGGTHLVIVGEDSEKLADALFAQFPDTKRNGYKWKFKKVSIPGIEEPLTLQVHQGVYGTRNTANGSSGGCCNETYFHTFDNEKYKQQKLATQKETEERAITIYLKRGRNFDAATKEEAEIIKNYLTTLYS